MKNKEKVIKSFNDEIGVINIIDIEKILKPKQNFLSLPLSIEKNEDIYFKGISSINKATGTEDLIKENDEKAKSKEKKKTNRKKKIKEKEENKN